MTFAPLTLRSAPYTAFDDATFGIRPNEGGGYPDWTVERHQVSRHVPGGGRTVIQNMGTGKAMTEWEIFCDTREEFLALLAKVGTTGTLTCVANMQSIIGTRHTKLTKQYEDISSVLLYDIVNIVYEVGGQVEATCIFWRAGGLA